MSRLYAPHLQGSADGSMNSDQQRPLGQNTDHTDGVVRGVPNTPQNGEHRSQARPGPGDGASPKNGPTATDARPGTTKDISQQNPSGPRIRVTGGSLSKNADEAEKHLLNAKVEIYQRGSKLVRPVIQEMPAKGGGTTKTAALEEVSETYLLDRLCKHMTWLKPNRNKSGWRRVDPPREVARLLRARAGYWKFLPVVGIIQTPVMLMDGSILYVPGYHKTSGLILFDPPSMPPVSDCPTTQDAKAALSLLEGLLEDFPFVDGASKSVALSALITPAVRPALKIAPMHVIRSPTPGTGKSYLVDLVSAIYSGAPCPVIAKGETTSELEKRINASLIAGRPLISIDNVNGDLEGDYLCQAIERPQLDVRIFGKSEHARVDNNFMLFATGNNLRLVGDVVRRSIVCTLDANRERPELRSFTSDPIASVSARRGDFIAAALTVVRAHQVARGTGLEPPSQVGSLTEWSELVRGALNWLGCADPLATMDTARENDPEIEGLRNVFVAIAQTIGVGEANARTAAEIIQVGKDNSLESALVEVGVKGKPGESVFLGQWLGRHVDRVIGQHKLLRIRKGKHAAKWYVADLSKSDNGGGV
jgi:putative DNA primase/helicase